MHAAAAAAAVDVLWSKASGVATTTAVWSCRAVGEYFRSASALKFRQTDRWLGFYLTSCQGLHTHTHTHRIQHSLHSDVFPPSSWQQERNSEVSARAL